MIHMVQCLCGVERHTIYAVMYDDASISPEDAKNGLKALIEMQVDHKIMNRRCEMCDKDIAEFWYEDHVMKEQNWDRAVARAKLSEADQTLTRMAVQAARKAGKN